MIKRVDPENHRQVKANDSYYLLKKTATPIVIVECGFLSNSAEAEKLCNEDYQERIAWAIHMGILQYLNGE
jgi:N-acetylmuramoyl-L-alanine amidase